MKTELDFMEYATDALAQAAYVSSDSSTSYGSDFLTGGTSSADSEENETSPSAYGADDNTGTRWSSALTVVEHWWKYDLGSGVTKIATKLRMQQDNVAYASTFYIYGSNNDSDWDLLYSATGGVAATWQTWEFTNTTAYRYYKMSRPVGSGYNNNWSVREFELMELIPANLQCYSESTIKQQGSYSLKGVAKQTDSLNDTLTRTLPKAPISHWKMNDNAANTTVVDSVGSNNGTAQQNTSALHTTGKINGALTFNGTSDYVNCGNDSSLDITNAISISVWVKHSMLKIGFILSKHTEAESGYEIHTNASGGFRFLIHHGNPTFTALDTNTVINNNVWHHLVCTFDGTTMKAFIDSVEDPNTANYSGTIPITSNSLQLGRRSPEGSYVFTGTIDDVRIYNYALNQSEIASLYKQGNGTETSDFRIDLSGLNTIKYDIYSASRTGSNIKVGIHDSGGTTTETTPNITSTGVWQKVEVDISGVSDANKDAIDSIIVTIVNADSSNTFYLDNMYAETISGTNPLFLSMNF